MAMWNAAMNDYPKRDNRIDAIYGKEILEIRCCKLPGLQERLSAHGDDSVLYDRQGRLHLGRRQLSKSSSPEAYLQSLCRNASRGIRWKLQPDDYFDVLQAYQMFTGNRKRIESPQQVTTEANLQSQTDQQGFQVDGVMTLQL